MGAREPISEKKPLQALRAPPAREPHLDKHRCNYGSQTSTGLTRGTRAPPWKCLIRTRRKSVMYVLALRALPAQEPHPDKHRCGSGSQTGTGPTVGVLDQDQTQSPVYLLKGAPPK